MDLFKRDFLSYHLPWESDADAAELLHDMRVERQAAMHAAAEEMEEAAEDGAEQSDNAALLADEVEVAGFLSDIRDGRQAAMHEAELEEKSVEEMATEEDYMLEEAEGEADTAAAQAMDQGARLEVCD